MKSRIFTILLFVSFLLLSKNIFSRATHNKISPETKSMLEMAKGKNSFQNYLLHKTTSTNSVLDSAIVIDTDGEMTKHIYTYTPNGSWSSYISKISVDGVWQDNMTMTYIYDSMNRLISSTGSMWSDGVWVKMMNYTLTYNGKYLSTTQSEILMGDTWIIIENSSFTYDESSKTQVEIYKDAFNSNTERFTEVYDQNDNIISILEEIEVDGGWESKGFSEFTYNSNRQETSETRKIWDGSQWNNSVKYVYTYDVNYNRTIELFQHWEGADWKDSYKNDITFDTNNYMTSNINSFWNEDSWVNGWRLSYDYSDNGSTMHGLSEANYDDTWELRDGEFHFFDSRGYYTDEGQSYLFDGVELNAYFGVITDVKDDRLVGGLPSDFVLEQNYPNPFNPTTNIAFTVPNNVETSRDLSLQTVSLEIYDLLGKKIATLVNEQKYAGNYSVEFDGSNLTSGIYFYRLTASSSAITKKMMLLK